VIIHKCTHLITHDIIMNVVVSLKDDYD